MSLFAKLFGDSQKQPENTAPRITASEKKEASPKTRNSTACPRCGSVFASPPKRKTTCPECDEVCYVRSKQLIFNSDLLTEEQALAADFYKELTEQGAEVKDYATVEVELKKKWGFKPNPYDVVWSVSNQLAAKIPARTNSTEELLHEAKMLLFSQAKYQALRGKDPTSYLGGVNDYDRQIAELRGAKEFRIETKGCCSTCSKQQGKRYAASYLKENKVLPIEGCTYKFSKSLKHGWCLCWLSPLYDFDLKE